MEDLLIAVSEGEANGNNEVVIVAILSLLGTLGAAAIAAFASIRTRKDIKTNSGKNIGQHVESQGERLNQLHDLMTVHSQLDAERFDSMEARLDKMEEYTHDRWHKDDNRYTAIMNGIRLLVQDKGKELELGD